MLEWLWGLKTVAIFDFWTYEHILTGLSVGSATGRNNKKHLTKFYPNLRINIFTKYRMDLAFLLFFAYAWETVEHYLEQGLAGSLVQFWFQGVEFWPNRLITDPLMLIVGYFLVNRYPRIVWPARIISLSWLLIHIFIFPHSMFLHTLFG